MKVQERFNIIENQNKVYLKKLGYKIKIAKALIIFFAIIMLLMGILSFLR